MSVTCVPILLDLTETHNIINTWGTRLQDAPMDTT